MRKIALCFALLIPLLVGCQPTTEYIEVEKIVEVPVVVEVVVTPEIVIPASPANIPEPSPEPQIRIASGGLLGHGTILEQVAIVIYNYGDVDIEIAGFELVMDGESYIYRPDNLRTVLPGEKVEVSVRPMIEEYVGNIIVVIKLLAPDGTVLYTHPETHVSL